MTSPPRTAAHVVGVNGNMVTARFDRATSA
jgi:hypothetical protein